MNDSKLYEIPEDVGYWGPLLLSISVHLLLVGSLWIGASFHQAPMAKNTVGTNELLPMQHPDMAAGNESRHASPTKAGEASSETARGEFSASAARGEPQAAIHLPGSSSQNNAVAGQSRASSRQSVAASGHSSRPKHENAKLATATKLEKPSVKEKGLAKTTRKTVASPPKRVAKADSIGGDKKALVKRTSKKSDVAEVKKLQTLREAELRRISKNVS